MNFDRFVLSRQPGFDEKAARRAFSSAIPLRTLVVSCMDPRASGVPQAVAREFGETYPGEIIRDEKGAKVGATGSLTTAVTVGGRAIDALRTITTLNHMLNLKNVVVVHHTFCGLTGFTPEGLFRPTSRNKTSISLTPISERTSRYLVSSNRSGMT